MDTLRTGLCALLGVELPIVQALIGSATCPALAAAVSNAGGVGMLALSWTDEGSVRRAIHETRDLTDRPFGVNLVLEWDQRERLAGWRRGYGSSRSSGETRRLTWRPSTRQAGWCSTRSVPLPKRWLQPRRGLT